MSGFDFWDFILYSLKWLVPNYWPIQRFGLPLLSGPGQGSAQVSWGVLFDVPVCVNEFNHNFLFRGVILHYLWVIIFKTIVVVFLLSNPLIPWPHCPPLFVIEAVLLAGLDGGALTSTVKIPSPFKEASYFKRRREMRMEKSWWDTFVNQKMLSGSVCEPFDNSEFKKWTTKKRLRQKQLWKRFDLKTIHENNASVSWARKTKNQWHFSYTTETEN